MNDERNISELASENLAIVGLFKDGFGEFLRRIEMKSLTIKLIVDFW